MKKVLYFLGLVGLVQIGLVASSEVVQEDSIVINTEEVLFEYLPTEIKDEPFDTTALIRQVVAQLKKESRHDIIEKLSKRKRLWGIDISKYQRRINWDLLVKRNKPDFVFVKATEGVTIRDKMYKKHKRNLEKHDILHGAYHFWSFRTNGTAQAKKFIRFANLKKGNLAPVVDVEYGRRRLPSKRKVVRELKRFCKVIEKRYGVKPIIYTQPHLYANYLKDDFKGYPIWFANYSRRPKGKWAIWQHTARARLYGVHGRVDKNIMKSDIDILRQLVML